MEQSFLSMRDSLPLNLDNSRMLLHLVQKTSGLFNRVQAGNTAVVGKASKSGFEIDDDMDNCGAMDSEGNEDNLILNASMELAENDYLDSFMDIADFLQLEDPSKVPEIAFTNANKVTDGKLNLPGVTSGSSTVLTAIVVPDPVISTSLLSRKRVGEIDDVVPVIDIGHKLPMLDHSHITKKPKLAIPAVSLKSAPQCLVPKVSEKDRYRECRDRNNKASRRSRQAKNLKLKEMDKQADIYIVENEALRRQIEQLEALAKTMKATLIQKMTEK